MAVGYTGPDPTKLQASSGGRITYIAQSTNVTVKVGPNDLMPHSWYVVANTQAIGVDIQNLSGRTIIHETTYRMNANGAQAGEIINILPNGSTSTLVTTLSAGQCMMVKVDFM